MTKFTQAIIATMMLPGVTLADAVHHSYDGRQVVIKFDEPVVPLSVVQNAGNDKASEQERGLHLFDLTGCDAQFLPEARWLDQDRLQLRFRKGFEGSTVFRVAFRPGVDKYLSGAQMPQPVFEFSYKPQEPDSMEVNGGLPTAATCVYVQQPLTKAQLEFSPSSPVSYVFREVVNPRMNRHQSERYGRTVQGKASAAQVQHLQPRRAMQMLFGDKKPTELKRSELEKISLNTPVPGCVLVQAAEPLTGQKDWELVAIPEEQGCDLVEGVFSVEKAEPLGMIVCCDTDEKGDKSELLLQLGFNAPVLKSSVPHVFRQLELKVGDAVAVNSEDGQSKTITLPGGKTLTFTLQPVKREPVRVAGHPLYNRDGSVAGEKEYSYNAPYTEAFEVAVSGSAQLPQLLDVCLPAGVQAMLGASNAEPLRMRLSLAPALPCLGSSSGSLDAPVLVPLKGEHKLQVKTRNTASLEVRAVRLTPEQFLDNAKQLADTKMRTAAELAAIQYNLALLKTRRSIDGMEVTQQQILQSEKTLRRMLSMAGAGKPSPLKGVEFSATQKVPVDVAAQVGMGEGVGTIDLDALCGGQAAPGFYIVSVTNIPTEDVCQQLRSIGANPALYSWEQWYPVLLTDLCVVQGTGAIAAYHLSDGSPVQQGQVLQVNREPVALQHAVAVMPRVKHERNRRSSHWVVLQSGDDYRPVLWNDRSPRMENDSRMELVRDRGIYRPGDTVHMRGVLRTVSPQGVPSIPSERLVQFNVNRPNGTRLLEKKLRVNEYGAFSVDFTLPEGDEDVTGEYRVMALSNDFRAYSYVSCQVFRRDSFEVKKEVTMQSVRPSEYTVKVTATDLNGMPLSGGKLKLNTEVMLGKPTKGGSPQDNHQSETHHLTLGKDGTATYTGKLPELEPASVYNVLSVSGEVRNDREEVQRLAGSSQSFYPADFTGRLKEQDTLLLDKVVKSGERSSVLDREQTVNLRLLSWLPRENEMSNGIVVKDYVRVRLWEGNVTVPANAVNGVPTGMMERWKQFAESVTRNAESSQNAMLRSFYPPMIVEMTGTDSDGRKIFQTLSSYTPRNWWNGSYMSSSRTTVENGQVKTTIVFPHAGQALVVLRSVNGVRVLPPVQVKEGENVLTLPLAEGELGNVQLSVLLPKQEAGLYQQLNTANMQVMVPNAAATLKVELKLPQQDVRPGARVTLGGKVSGADGKPAAAQVTLFAVDAGMLSVGKHSVPNLLEEFTRIWVEGYTPRTLSFTSADRLRNLSAPRLFEGVWTGQWLDAQGRIIKRPSFGAHRYGMTRNTMMAMGGARVMRKNRLAVPAASAGVDADMMMDGPELAVAEECAEPMSMEAGSAKLAAPVQRAASAPSDDMRTADTAGAPRLRTNFVPVAVWCPGLNVDSNGNFTTEVTLPDTFTTYKVYALALGKDGKRFGNAEGEFRVNQPVMLTPGTPFFMSTGDRLRLPLTITNATDQAGAWVVMLEGAQGVQRITLQPRTTSTLYFDYTAVAEGERKLRWKAVSPAGSDAVEGEFAVRFPAPVLKEAHHLVLNEGGKPLTVAGLLAPELAGSTRGELQVLLSANPLLHLYGCMELVQNRAYPCTQYSATSMMVWMLYERLAPFSPIMAQTPPAEARKAVTMGIAELLKCQREDGGISYWCGARQSSPWASAYVGLVLTLAQEQGFEVSADAMKRLQDYLHKQLELSRKPRPEVTFSPFDLYAIGRTIGDRKVSDDALAVALKSAEKNSAEAAIFAPVQQGCCWWRTSYAVASLRFLGEMSRDKEDIHADFLKWMRAVGHDYRHATHWDGGWMLIALHEYLRRTPGSNAEATVTLQDGQRLTLGQGMTTIAPAATATLGQLPTTLTPTAGTAYVTVQAKALPEQTEYPGVTEKGLQVTRIYEKRGEDGVWREAREFNVGDVVRVTLTCAKSDRELEYFVLEDYLPASMEAINPNVPSQAAGLEWSPWSYWFDHKEYLSYRVRGFCTRWGGRDLLNMSYYARVKRAGTATAPPAQAQLMYEPQTYGLSPNAVIISH